LKYFRTEEEIKAGLIFDGWKSIEEKTKELNSLKVD
jgi:hypothetical protein